MTDSVRSRERTERKTDIVLTKNTRREERTSQETLRITKESNYFRNIVFTYIGIIIYHYYVIIKTFFSSTLTGQHFCKHARIINVYLKVFLLGVKPTSKVSSNLNVH